MSIRSHAKSELQLAGVEPDCQLAILGALDLVLDAFDSGAAAAIGFDIFTRLWAGKPLTPLTGEDSEWMDVDDRGHTFQNVRCGSVFKTGVDIPHRGFKAGDCYDIDASTPTLITFPYWPGEAKIPSPVYEVIEKDDGPTAAK